MLTPNNLNDKGFALFIAIVITGALLLISTGIVNLAIKQLSISGSGSNSQHAFYAADTGLECALYWDVSNPNGATAFATTTGSLIECNHDSNNTDNEWVVGGADVSTFTITFAPDSYCAVVTVTKEDDGDTIVESRGYNTCGVSARRVERAVRATY